jgi:hypothetical protein
MGAAMPTAFVKHRPSGWPLAMHVIPLEGSDLLVHSPTWIDEQTVSQLRAMGTPRILFAPNHFHHLSLARYRELFPEATVVASAGAIPRLRARGHEGLRSTDEVALPSGFRWLVPEGTRSGEAWLSIDGEGGPTWVVCDAFFNAPAPLRGVEGAILRLAKTGPGLSIGMTYTLMCIRDKARYREWVKDALTREKPQSILFSHGDPLQTDVAAALRAIIGRRLS